MRQLRNHGGEVLDRVEAGESLTVTRDGRAVARLVPLPRKGLTAAAFLQHWRRLPYVDPSDLRSDIDAVLDQSL